MGFIMSVFGSNLFILFAGFVYIWVAIFMYKFWVVGDWCYDEDDIGFFSGLFSIAWPLTLPLYITTKLLCWFIPITYKLIEKTVPDVTFKSKD